MSREGYGLLRFVSSDDGTRCAAECPHVVRAVGQGDCDECAAFTDILSFNNGANVRLPACIAAEQAAASVPSCEGARGLDASEALREARMQGMREAQAIVDIYPYCPDASRAIYAAIEAVRKGER